MIHETCSCDPFDAITACRTAHGPRTVLCHCQRLRSIKGNMVFDKMIILSSMWLQHALKACSFRLRCYVLCSFGGMRGQGPVEKALGRVRCGIRMHNFRAISRWCPLESSIFSFPTNHLPFWPCDNALPRFPYEAHPSHLLPSCVYYTVASFSSPTACDRRHPWDLAEGS